MDLLLQIYYFAIEEKSGGCCAKIFGCERLFCHGLETSPIIIKVKAAEILLYDITKGFYTQGFLVIEGFDALTNLYTLCTQFPRPLNTLFSQLLWGFNTLSFQISRGFGSSFFYNYRDFSTLSFEHRRVFNTLTFKSLRVFSILTF